MRRFCSASCLLLGQRKARDVDDVVHHPHGVGDERRQPIGVEPRLGGERVVDKPRQVQRAEEARAVRRQRLLSAGVGRVDPFAIPQVVAAIDAVDEDDAGFGIGVGRAHDLVPQFARGEHLGDALRLIGAAKGQLPRSVLGDRLHKGVGHQHTEVEHPEAPGLGLRLDERLDVGVLAAEGRHHRAAAIARAHDRAAHRVPHIHERQGARGVGADPVHRRALRPEGREIIADAAALLHRQRRLAQMGENAAHVVGDRPHHKAVEQGDLAPGAGAGDDPPGRQKLKIAHRRVKPLGPALGVFFRRRDRPGDAPPGVLDRLVDRLAGDRSIGRPLQPVLHVPDLLRDRGDGGHGLRFRSK